MRSMKGISILSILIALSVVLAFSGCTSPATSPVPSAAAPTATAAPVSGPVALAITGKVMYPLNLTVSDLDAYTQHYAAWQNQAGNSSYNGTGPYAMDLLNKANMTGGATNITFACTDPANSFSSTMTIDDLVAKYNDSIIAHNWTKVDKQGQVIKNTNNTLQLIVPAGGGKNQVANINLITVS